jgi:hypothetical protein
MTSKNGAILAGLVTAATVALICVAMFAPDSIVYSREIKHGDEIVRSIDVFREREGKLPTSLSELGTSDKDLERYFYQPCTDRRFIVWFGTRLGKSISYNSATHKWEPLNLMCNGAEVGP